MICAICRHAEPQPGTTTVTLERAGTTIVLQHVPALVCPSCGEAYLGEDVSRRVERAAAQAAQAGVKLDVRDYAVV